MATDLAGSRKAIVRGPLLAPCVSPAVTDSSSAVVGAADGDPVIA